MQRAKRKWSFCIIDHTSVLTIQDGFGTESRGLAVEIGEGLWLGGGVAPPAEFMASNLTAATRF